MKTTPWYPCSIKPVRNGWYEVSYGGTEIERMRYFYGGTWYCNAKKVKCLFGNDGTENDCWRGLAKE